MMDNRMTMTHKFASVALSCTAWCLSSVLLMPSQVAAQAAAAANPSAAADYKALDSVPKSKRIKFLEECAARTVAHDPKVMDDCYTKDFRLAGNFEVRSAPNRELIGREAVCAKMVWGTGDKSAFKSLKRYILYYIEQGDKIAYQRRWVAEGPKGSYAGFSDLDPNLKVEMDALEVFTFRDGKIASEFWAYDTMGFALDFAGGDPQKVAASLERMKPFMQQLSSGKVQGNCPIPPQ
jgi:SnoaL-like polyketide cyclase